MRIIKSLNWILSYGCNCRCSHCDIWRSKDHLVINPDSIKKALDTALLRQSYDKLGKDFDIALGGGEPFLSPHLTKVVQMIDREFPLALKCISTNGLLTRPIVSLSKSFERINFKFNISVDGIGERHDDIRGIKGSFARVMETVAALKEVTPLRKIELKLTLLPANFDQIVAVYELSRRLGCDFSFKPAENIRSYTNRHADLRYSFSQKMLCAIRNQSFEVADQMRKTGNFRQEAFLRDIPFYLAGLKKQGFCNVSRDNFTLMPDGSLYGCLFMTKIGRIKDSGIKFSKPANISKKCPTCMLMCGYFKQYKNQAGQFLSANVEVTHNCNLNCKICTQGELRKKTKAAMSTSKLSEVIKKHKGISHVSFIGGEPFLNKDIFGMFGLLDSMNITYEVTTNATMLNRQIFRKLRSLVGLKQMNISIDGLKKYHDLERGNGVYDKCVLAIKELGDYLNICVCSVLKNDNFNQILKLNETLPGSVREHKIIYCVSFSNESLQESRNKFPALEIQGPAPGFSLLEHKVLAKMIKVLRAKNKNKGTKVVFEPALISRRNGATLGRIFCKQLGGVRIDPFGKRIICEFIRNEFDQAIVDALIKEPLPICRFCCKLESMQCLSLKK